MGKEPRLLDQVRASMRTKHHSDQTEQSYVQWIRRFILFHQKRHPKKMGRIEIEMYLTHLKVNRNASVSLQNQALSALLYLYREVLERDIPWPEDGSVVNKPAQMLDVLGIDEAHALLSKLRGDKLIVASLLYGSGLRLSECLSLRVHDIDFEKRQIVIRDHKDGKEQTEILPESLIGPLKHQVSQVRIIHEKDIHGGFGEVYLPIELERKYPDSVRALGRQYLFPAENISLDHRSGKYQRHCIAEEVIQHAVKQAGRDAGISKQVSCDTLRQSFANHRLEIGQKDDIKSQSYDSTGLPVGLDKLSPLEPLHY